VSVEDWLSVRVLTEKAGEAFKKVGHYPAVKILDRGVDAGLSADDRVFAGLVWNETLHLTREGIGSEAEADAVDTVWHELFHYGLRRFLTRV
jgi:hypothetical protein